jgi:5'-3' exonuclease
MLLDTSSLTYRAYFALPTSISGQDGRPVNAVRGYLDMTGRLVRDRQPDEVIHCFDHDWRPAPRVAAYAGYKAERAAEPDDLTHQFTLLEEVLDALGQAVAVAPGWEADDAIGVLCARAEAGDDTEIVTGDRDLIQLVRDQPPAVRVLFTVKGVSELAVLDEAAVVERYGIPPRRYVDYAILRGDPSDGLPGIKGVGEKTARQLVAAHPDLEDLAALAAGARPAVAAALRDAADYLAVMREVVPVRTDVEVQVRRSRLDEDRLDELASAHNLASPVGRLREALHG